MKKLYTVFFHIVCDVEAEDQDAAVQEVQSFYLSKLRSQDSCKVVVHEYVEREEK